MQCKESLLPFENTADSLHLINVAAKYGLCIVKEAFKLTVRAFGSPGPINRVGFDRRIKRSDKFSYLCLPMGDKDFLS